MRHRYYRLEGRVAVPCTLEEVCRDLGNPDSRRVARTMVNGADVSTVFLEINHDYRGGPPILFETMVFADDERDGMQDRCSTWEEAEEMHAQMVKECQHHD